MLFTSISFLYYFLPALIIIYFITPKKYKNIILLIASLLFYFYGEPKYVFLMILEIIIAYIGAILIDKYKNQSKNILIITLFIHVFLLIIFKYTDFIIQTINDISNANIKLLNIALPIGISFYTFQIISYIIDVYNGKFNVQKNIIKLATYVSLFLRLLRRDGRGGVPGFLRHHYRRLWLHHKVRRHNLHAEFVKHINNAAMQCVAAIRQLGCGE